MAQSWYLSRNGQRTGVPISVTQLRALAQRGQLLPADLVWTEGMPQWVPASSLKGLPFPDPAVREEKRIRSVMACPACGMQIPVQAQSCSHCGHPKEIPFENRNREKPTQEKTPGRFWGVLGITMIMVSPLVASMGDGIGFILAVAGLIGGVIALLVYRHQASKQMKPCLGCGKPFAAYILRLREGRCHQCHRESKLNDPASCHWSKLTLAGWLLSLVTIGSFAGLFILYDQWLSDPLVQWLGIDFHGGGAGGEMAEGLLHVLISLPVLIAAFAFFAFSSLALKQLGLPVWKEPGQSGNQSRDDGQTV